MIPEPFPTGFALPGQDSKILILGAENEFDFLHALQLPGKRYEFVRTVRSNYDPLEKLKVLIQSESPFVRTPPPELQSRAQNIVDISSEDWCYQVAFRRDNVTSPGLYDIIILYNSFDGKEFDEIELVIDTITFISHKESKAIIYFNHIENMRGFNQQERQMIIDRTFVPNKWEADSLLTRAYGFVNYHMKQTIPPV